jgi:CubicO group peptidase (beta-lactamase class C family)
MADALQPFIDDHVISGAVMLIANKDKILHEEAFGLADIETKRPMADDTLFAIYSMSKPVTCVALLMLADEGKININDPVEKYLPEFKGQMVKAPTAADPAALKPPSHPMMVRELLDHTSGLGWTYPSEHPKADTLTLAEHVRSYAQAPLETDPGTKYLYSNPGINTVGRLVEVVSGMPFEKFLATRLFEPLGMKDTSFVPNAERLSRLAQTYFDTPTGLKKMIHGDFTYPLDDPKRQPIPSEGLFSTAGDMTKFCQMVLNDGVYEGKRYLAAQTVQMMQARQTPPGMKANRGFPWAKDLGKNNEGFGHGGAYRTYMIIDPKENFIAVLMEQHKGGWLTPEGKQVYPTFIQTAYDVAGIPASVRKTPEP